MLGYRKEVRDQPCDTDKRSSMNKYGELVEDKGEQNHILDKDISFPTETCHDTDKHLERFPIPNIAHMTVHKILFHNCVIICGSKGLLMGCYTGWTRFYRCNKRMDFIGIEIMKTNTNVFLVAFTKGHIIIYNVNDVHPYMEFDLPGIKHTFNDNGGSILITLDSGEIKTLTSNCTIKDHVTKVDPSATFFSPTNSRQKFAFVSLTTPTKDSLLYKTASMTDLETKVVVEGVKNVKMVITIKKQIFLCYSDETVWILDWTCAVKSCVTFEFGIKIVEVKEWCVFVVDRANGVHWFHIDKVSFRVDMHQRQLQGNVTALGFSKEKVLIAIDGGIFALDHTA